ncbi:MAG TPA: sodium:solute symporter, partial [Cytophagales bacterium]|nr:sodium:solute symporter [Cytophagales bacterium]
MSPSLVLFILLTYFAILIAISVVTSKGATSDTFFTANRQSPWYLVAYGMIGASLSGVTFISVPANVGNTAFSYFQVVLGYVLGYWVIIGVLMPLYYRLNLISIYSYLEDRFDRVSYKTGSFFFLLSRSMGSSLRLFLAASVLQLFLFDAWDIPFVVTVAITIFFIWIYTFKGGIKTIVWTDTFQTTFLILAVVISVVLIAQRLDLSFVGLLTRVFESDYSQIFFFDDPKSTLFFPKQFFGGAFIAITMTGMDQDLMQKNLTCRNLGDAQKNMFWLSSTLVVVNLLFLILGALLYIYSTEFSIPLPTISDELFPMLAFNEFGLLAAVLFLLGITASTYASSDSALAALTTSFCIDFLDFKNKPEVVKQKQKNMVHVGFSVLFLIIILIFKEINERSLIDAVLMIAGYTYGPLLGLFAFGVFSKRKVKGNWVPIVCLLSPIICYLLVLNAPTWFNGYKVG